MTRVGVVATVANSRRERPVRKPKDSLSNRQQRIVSFIRDYVATYGYSPSVREIGAAVGLKQPSSVAYQLRQLAEWGAVEFAPNRPRALRLVTDESVSPHASCEHCGCAGVAS